MDDSYENAWYDVHTANMLIEELEDELAEERRLHGGVGDSVNKATRKLVFALNELRSASGINTDKVYALVEEAIDTLQGE